MEQQPIIIAKNVSESSQKFLGSIIQAGAQSQISDIYFQNEITGSSELRALINSGDIVINNGSGSVDPCGTFLLARDLVPPSPLGSYPSALSTDGDYCIAGDKQTLGKVHIFKKCLNPYDSVLEGVRQMDNPVMKKLLISYFTRKNTGTAEWDFLTALVNPMPFYTEFGKAVAINGNYAVVGAGASNSTGRCYVYKKDQGGTDKWGQIATLVAWRGGRFGDYVAINGGYIVVGAWLASDGSGSQGEAYVYKQDQGGADNWGYLTELDNGVASDDYFGYSVSISADNCIVGAHNGPVGGTQVGAAYVFNKDYGGVDNWGLVKTLEADVPANLNDFGIGVSIDGDYALCGCKNYPGAGGAVGAVFIFEKNTGGANQWGQVKRIEDPATGGLNDFGRFVSISAGRALVSSKAYPPIPPPGSGQDYNGRVYIFSKDCNDWSQVFSLVGASPQDELGGVPLSLSDTYAAFGGSGYKAFMYQTEGGSGDLSIAAAIALCCYPYSMLNATTSGTDNASVGTSTLENITTGDCNTAIGDQALPSLTTGSDNIAVGTRAGCNYTENESDNILLGHPGATGESGTIRIGTSTQTSAHIAGIHGVTPAGSASTQESVIIDSNGYLGSAASFPRLIESYVDTTLTTTTSASLRTRMNATIPILLAGDYSLNINYCWNHNGHQGTRTDFISVITFDGTILGNSPANSLPDTHRQEPKDADGSGGPTGTNQQYSWSKTFILENIAAGSKSLTLQYRSSLAGTTSSIWNIVYILNYIHTAPPDPCLAFSKLQDIDPVLPVLSGENWGYSVSISGNYALLGAPYATTTNVGAVDIFLQSGGMWTQVQRLSGLSANDWFGYNVSISDDYAIVSARGYDEGGQQLGAAYIFTHTNGVWQTTANAVKLVHPINPTANYHFAYSISISGDYAIVGAPREYTTGQRDGAAYIYTAINGVWDTVKPVKLVSDIPVAYDYFGTNVSINGDYAIVGAPGDSTAGPGFGAAFIFLQNGGVWTQVAKLLGTENSQFGGRESDFSVSINGDYAIVGAPQYGNTNAGAAWIYTHTNGVWQTTANAVQKLGGNDWDYFGSTVSMNGDYAAIGTNDGPMLAGAAYIYSKDCGGDGTFGLATKITGETDGESCSRVAMDDLNVLIGAFAKDTTTTDTGGAYMYVRDAP